MEYLKLNTEQNQLLDNINKMNTSNMKIMSIPYDDYFIIPSDILDDDTFNFYKPLLKDLVKIIIY